MHAGASVFQENNRLPQQECQSQEFPEYAIIGELGDQAAQILNFGHTSSAAIPIASVPGTSQDSQLLIQPFSTSPLHVSSVSLSGKTRNRHRSEQMQDYHQSSFSQLSLESSVTSIGNRVQSLQSLPRNATSYSFQDESHIGLSLESSNTSASSILLPSSHQGVGYDLSFVCSQASDLSSAPSDFHHRMEMSGEEFVPYSCSQTTFGDEQSAAAFQPVYNKVSSTKNRMQELNNGTCDVNSVKYSEDAEQNSQQRLSQQKEQNLKIPMLTANQSIEHADELQKLNTTYPSAAQPVLDTTSSKTVVNSSDRDLTETITSRQSPFLTRSLHSKGIIIVVVINHNYGPQEQAL